MVVHQKILHLLLYEKSYGNRNNLQVENTQDWTREGGGNTTSIKISIARYDCKHIDCKHIA